MQRHRFYDPGIGAAGDRLALSVEESHHLLRVLRLRRGDEVYVFDGRGNEFKCRFTDTEAKRAVVEIVEALTDAVESGLRVTLAQALTKGEKFDLIVQKTTELGVARIVPLMTDYADVKLKGEQAQKRLERWQRISLEALKQSGRRRLVDIKEPVELGRFFETGSSSTDERIFCSERGGATLSQALGCLSESPEKGVTVFIGPEGGWSQTEAEWFAAHDCRAVTLGRRILRAETAAIAAVALVQHLFGDLSR